MVRLQTDGFSSRVPVAMARPAPPPLLGVVPDPAAAHLELASQIYAWMAQAGTARAAARNSKDT